MGNTGALQYSMCHAINTSVLYTPCRYFKFVQRIQAAVGDWSHKFSSGTLNEMLLYCHYDDDLHKIGEKFYASLVEREDVKIQITEFFKTFRELNDLLLCHIPGRSDPRCHSLPSLLENYSVCLPPEVLQLVTTKISFPGNSSPSQAGVKWSTLPELEKEYEAYIIYGQDKSRPESLTLRMDISREELCDLIIKVREFLKPIKDNLKMLVFFKLTDSVLFSEYYNFFHREFIPHCKNLEQTTSKEGTSAYSTISRPKFTLFKKR